MQHPRLALTPLEFDSAFPSYVTTPLLMYVAHDWSPSVAGVNESSFTAFHGTIFGSVLDAWRPSWPRKTLDAPALFPILLRPRLAAAIVAVLIFWQRGPPRRQRGTKYPYRPSLLQTIPGPKQPQGFRAAYSPQPPDQTPLRPMKERQ